jgi:dihydrofolate reductase
MCEDRGIGYKGQIPWHNKADLKYFSKLTRGTGENAIIMGSTTWKSLPNQYLPGRNNLIISSTLKIHKIMSDGHIIKTFESIDAVIKFCNLMEYEEVWIIGGESIYKQFLYRKIINKCYISTISKHYESDAFFPEINNNEWKLSNSFILDDYTFVNIFSVASLATDLP